MRTDNFDVSLETPSGVYAFLSDYHNLKSQAYGNSDYGLINVFVDFNEAFAKAHLTAHQRKVFNIVFMKGLSQQEAADYLGVRRQSVNQVIWNAVREISRQYTENKTGEGDNA